MDLFDQAQEAEERDRKQALAVALRSGDRKSGPSVSICIDCGAKIPEARRIAVIGCTRCVGCEHKYESEHRR